MDGVGNQCQTSVLRVSIMEEILAKTISVAVWGQKLCWSRLKNEWETVLAHNSFKLGAGEDVRFRKIFL